jgi:hypothetical protein
VALIVAAAGAALGTPVASAYQARGKVLVIASHENANAGLDSAAALRSLGFKVTLTLAPPASSWQLPNLKAYSSVWSMIGSRGYTGEQLAQVEEYVSKGGRLYLGGVPISPETNLNVDQEVARDVLGNSRISVIGDEGSATSAVYTAALDGIAEQPNQLVEIPQSAPGAVGGIELRNVLTKLVGKIFSSAAFDEADMVSGKGRLVIYTDEWSNSQLPPSLRNAFVENVQDFLEGTPTRVSRTSAQYVALGDDFASGVGSFEYLPETTGRGGCYRAANGYAERVSSDDEMSLAFDACRGATIESLLGRKGGKEPQLDDVGPSTKAITLSTGWNDLGYGSVIKKCLSTREQREFSEECRIAQNAAVEEARAWLDDGREPGVYELPGGKKSINHQYLPSLAELYETILYQAPEAELVVVGYPRLFDSGVEGRFGPCQVGTSAHSRPIYIAADNAAWMNDQTIALDSQIKRAVELVQSRTGRAIRYADANSAFTGHSLCDLDTPWINGRLLEGTRPALESFQPTSAGQKTLRELVESTATEF